MLCMCVISAQTICFLLVLDSIHKNNFSSMICLSKMKKHFNLFSKGFLNDEENHAFYGRSLMFENLLPKHITDKLVGCFLNYLVTATPQGNKKRNDDDDGGRKAASSI